MHLVAMATEQPCDREALALQPFTDDDMARVSQWLAALPLAECIILAGDGDHVTTDMIGIRWSEDQAEGRWSCRLPTCSKAYLQHFIAYLRCAASWTQHTVHRHACRLCITRRSYGAGAEKDAPADCRVRHGCGHAGCIRIEHIYYGR